MGYRIESLYCLKHPALPDGAFTRVYVVLSEAVAISSSQELRLASRSRRTFVYWSFRTHWEIESLRMKSLARAGLDTSRSSVVRVVHAETGEVVWRSTDKRLG